MERAWPHGRAVLIAVAIFAAGIEGCPVRAVSTDELARPLNRREVERWAEMLDTHPDALAARVEGTTSAIARARDALFAPFRPYFDATRTYQRWSLFPIADREPYRMHVEARAADGDWQLLYRPLDVDATTRASVLEYRRVRGAWNPGSRGPRGAYPAFVDWLANDLFRARPELAEVRVRYERFRIPLPGEPRTNDRSFHFEEHRVKEPRP